MQKTIIPHLHVFLMKVCFFAKEYPPNIYGGVGIHVKYLTASLRKLMDVEVRTFGDPGVYGNVRYYPNPGRFSGTGPGSVLDTLLLDMDWVKDPLDADIVHTHTWYADMVNVLAKRLYGAKTVSTVHSLEPLRPWKAEQLGSGGYQLSSWMERTGVNDADRVIAVSKEMRDDIHKHLGVPKSRISVIYNGIDLDKYRRTDRRLLDEPYVLFVGRVSRQKGIFQLIKAFKKVHGHKLVLVLGRPDTPELASELEKAVLGRTDIIAINRQLSEEDVISYYSGAKLFVCPSVYEPFGIINLEAMACGAPVVASRVGGIKEVVRHGKNGILVEPGDVEGLAEAMNKVLGDEGLRLKLAKAGRPYVEKNFSWDRIAKQTFDLYTGL